MGQIGGGREEQIFGPATYLTPRLLRTEKGNRDSGIKGLGGWPYYALNPLRGGASKGGRGLGIQGLRD